MPLITFCCCNERRRKEGEQERSWPEKFAMPLAVVLASGLVSGIVSWFISEAQLKANDRVEMNKMIMAMHGAASSDERNAAVIGLAQFDTNAIPYLVGSLQTDSYPAAIRGLRAIGPRSVKVIEKNLLEGSYEPEMLIKALGDLGISTADATRVLELLLRKDQETTFRFFRTQELTKSAVLAWIKLGNRDQRIWEMEHSLNGVSFVAEGIREIRNLRLDRVSLLNVDLSRIDARDSDFRRTEISGLLRDGDFSRASFQNAIIREADLSRANFSDAKFTGATLDKVNFGDAILTNAVFDGATITDSSFYNADLTGATMVGAKFDPIAIGAAKVPPTP